MRGNDGSENQWLSDMPSFSTNICIPSMWKQLKVVLTEATKKKKTGHVPPNASCPDHISLGPGGLPEICPVGQMASPGLVWELFCPLTEIWSMLLTPPGGLRGKFFKWYNIIYNYINPCNILISIISVSNVVITFYFQTLLSFWDLKLSINTITSCLWCCGQRHKNVLILHR